MSASLSPRLDFASATLADVPFLDELRRRHAAALGFLSRKAIELKVLAGQVRVAKVDGMPVGFLMHGSLRGPEVRVFQLAVSPASRRLGVGKALVKDLLQVAARAGIQGLSLRCREKLPANRFWHQAGFQLHDLEQGSSSALYVWVRRIAPATRRLPKPARIESRSPRSRATRSQQARPAAGFRFAFSTRWHRCPGCQTWTCGSWTAGGVRRRHCIGCIYAERPAPANPAATST